MQTFFRDRKYPEAIQAYNVALNVAAARLPWEAQIIARDEMGVVLCNRAAALGAVGDVSCPSQQNTISI